MSLSAESLNHLASESGFRPEILEKVDRLIDLLQAICRDTFLGPRLALKGGTALNLFNFPVPRLSVDIDLNYVGALDRDTMLAERPQVERLIEAIASRQNLARTRGTGSHAGGKWSYRYNSVFGGGGTLEIDLNFMYRQPLWPVQYKDSYPLGPLVAKAIPLLDVHELAGGKLAALFGRSASRDLFDTHQLLTTTPLDKHQLRQAFVIYGAMNRRDWRTLSLDDLGADPREAKRQLFPLLIQRGTTRAKEQHQLLNLLIEETRERLRDLLPLTEAETQFITEILEQGVIRPELMGIGEPLASRISNHPALVWRAQQGDGGPEAI